MEDWPAYAGLMMSDHAVFMEGPDIGDLLFMGPGAGGGPTATAVLGDVIDAARDLLAGTRVAPRVRLGHGSTVPFSEISSQWYIRLEVADAPGVLASIAGAFGEHGVSIRSVWQDGRGDDATLLLVTHGGSEAAHSAAIAALDGLDTVKQVAATIRVISTDS